MLNWGPDLVNIDDLETFVRIRRELREERLFSDQDRRAHNPIHKFWVVIETHNAYLADLQDWRRLMARHAAELAGLIKSFPGADYLNEEVLQQTFSSSAGVREEVSGDEIFAPWLQRWSGTWSNGTPQYHVWHDTEYRDGQWIQPVTQSEISFAD
jgi:hypothetical protein